MSDDICVNCFLELDSKGVDWASVAKTTKCEDVTKFLTAKGICKDLVGKKDASKEFCETFTTCVIDDENEEDNEDEDEVDCGSLTSCEWPGMIKNLVGDGVCHERMPGCYNTAICNYDGGDCCADTCESDGQYSSCGSEGFACKDPKSENCDPELSRFCDNPLPPDDDSNANPAAIDCGPDQALYRLVMYDSFGDGWDKTKITITGVSSKVDVYSGSLKNGYKGTHYICLSTTPADYDVELSGGVWGNEVSWEVRPYSEGAPAVASGGAPMKCRFGIAGSTTKNTCTGEANIKPNDDPDYKEFKDLFNCMEDKCPIQVGACQEDPVCKNCFGDQISEYCYGVDAFNAATDCAICKCTDVLEDDSYCSSKLTPGAVIPNDNNEHNSSKKPCSPAETIKGSNAVMAFGKCTNFDEIGMMVTEFDQNHFGTLDDFESCSHSYNAKNSKKTALDCMQILVNAKNGKVDGTSDKAIQEAVSALAGLLYDDAESFCGCAKNASDACPLCPSFFNFKTLLYESLDACQSLDEIDCDAWQEFSAPCERNLREKFGGVDFSKRQQCDFVKDSCGGAGPFPAFRRLDCGSEVTQSSWEFYGLYATTCLGQKPNPGPEPSPTPKPYTPSTPTVAPRPSPFSPSDDTKPSNPKPYVPPEERGKTKKKKEASSSDGEKKSSHWFRNFLLLTMVGGAGYYVYKKRSEEFSFMRYRRMNRTFGDQDMYLGLSMEGSTTFEPPTLPPRPDATGADYYS